MATRHLPNQVPKRFGLAVLEGGEALNIAQADGPAIVGTGNWVGKKTKLHCAANGKVGWPSAVSR